MARRAGLAAGLVVQAQSERDPLAGGVDAEHL